jgi:hypothetical protein
LAAAESADEHAGPGGTRSRRCRTPTVFRQPTDVTWDTDGNTYISDGKSLACRIDKRGNG